MVLQLIAGFLIALLVSLLAYRLGSLNRSGALAALLLGTIVFGLGGLGWAVLLIGFFVSSSLLSRLFGRQKRALNEKFSKGSQRDALQVLANGGVAAAMVLMRWVVANDGWLWLAFAGSLAAANADTWATELGVLSRSQPRLLTTLRAVEPGASGGVSPTGTLAALGGSLFIGGLAALLPPPGFQPGAFTSVYPHSGHVIIITLAGLVGSLIDSLLGATLQAIYHCPACDRETERHPLHTCGSATRQVRGLHWMNNDLVNAACTFSGALTAILL